MSASATPHVSEYLTQPIKPRPMYLPGDVFGERLIVVSVNWVADGEQPAGGYWRYSLVMVTS